MAADRSRSPKAPTRTESTPPPKTGGKPPKLSKTSDTRETPGRESLAEKEEDFLTRWSEEVITTGLSRLLSVFASNLATEEYLASNRVRWIVDALCDFMTEHEVPMVQVEKMLPAIEAQGKPRSLPAKAPSPSSPSAVPARKTTKDLTQEQAQLQQLQAQQK
jgi:hypothetical protein